MARLVALVVLVVMLSLPTPALALKRYYISPVIGTGAKTNPIRAKLADVAPNFACVIAAAPFALCIVSGTRHDAISEDPENEILPDISLDAELAVLPAGTRADLIDRLQAWGIDTRGLTNGVAYRTMINRIGQHIEPAFSANGLDVSE